jgi:YVTN family beta-propeller protein
MKTNKKLCSIVLASIALVLFLIIVSSMALASPVQNSLMTGPYAYVTNYGSNNVSVIDTSNDTVIATINAGNYRN